MLTFKLLKNFIDDEFCDKYLQGEGWQVGSVTNGSTEGANEKNRRSAVRFYAHDKIPLYEKIKKYSDAYFDVGEIRYIDYQLTRYDEADSGFFHMHDDKIRTKTEFIRKISCSIFLSDPEDYEGGEFVFRDHDIKTIRDWDAKYNCVMFPSQGAFHGVLPVTKGTRYSLVCWGCGPNPDYDPNYKVWTAPNPPIKDQ